ncbi:hypothetical protein TRVL_08256 [Trypanosoma vivax]|nr:hypothetical protein TRVL_08256 [Trypanosoma vivax]
MCLSSVSAASNSRCAVAALCFLSSALYFLVAAGAAASFDSLACPSPLAAASVPLPLLYPPPRRFVRHSCTPPFLRWAARSSFLRSVLFPRPPPANFTVRLSTTPAWSCRCAAPFRPSARRSLAPSVMPLSRPRCALRQAPLSLSLPLCGSVRLLCFVRASPCLPACLLLRRSCRFHAALLAFRVKRFRSLFSRSRPVPAATSQLVTSSVCGAYAPASPPLLFTHPFTSSPYHQCAQSVSAVLSVCAVLRSCCRSKAPSTSFCCRSTLRVVRETIIAQCRPFVSPRHFCVRVSTGQPLSLSFPSRFPVFQHNHHVLLLPVCFLCLSRVRLCSPCVPTSALSFFFHRSAFTLRTPCTGCYCLL